MKRDLGWMLLATAASYPLGVALGQAWLLPLLNTAPAYVVLVRRLGAGRLRGAVGAMLLWALVLAVVGTTTFAMWPVDPGPRILHGPEYRAEMFAWIRTGHGTEGDPRLFLPQHVLHLVAFVAVCLASASAVGITLGAVLMNYMAYYVASLGRAGVPPGTLLLLGWQPWALCRVAAFCILGVVLAEPLLSRISDRPRAAFQRLRPYLVVAISLILADWTLKAALAPSWGAWLRAALPPA